MATAVAFVAVAVVIQAAALVYAVWTLQRLTRTLQLLAEAAAPPPEPLPLPPTVGPPPRSQGDVVSWPDDLGPIDADGRAIVSSADAQVRR